MSDTLISRLGQALAGVLCLPVLFLYACSGRPHADSLAARYGYEVVKAYPHDPNAFTQGLVWRDGGFYESTGLFGASSLRRVKLETGEVQQQFKLERAYFAEGLAMDGDRLIQLTWKNKIGFVYDRESFAPSGTFNYLSEGWGTTFDGGRFIMSDGSNKLRFLDRKTFQVTGSIEVRDGNRAISRLNELEMVDGRIYANIWQSDYVVIINPETGQVESWVDLSGLLNKADRAGASPDVLNGIAYDPEAKRLFVTGKKWPKLYEIKLVPKQ